LTAKSGSKPKKTSSLR